MLEMTGENHAVSLSGSSNNAFYFIAKSPGSNEEKPNAAVCRHQCDCFCKCQNSMPWSKRADKAGQNFASTDCELLPSFGAADIGAKLIRVNGIRVDDYLFISDSEAQKVSALNFGHDEDARRCLQIQTFESFQ